MSWWFVEKCHKSRLFPKFVEFDNSADVVEPISKMAEVCLVIQKTCENNLIREAKHDSNKELTKLTRQQQN